MRTLKMAVLAGPLFLLLGAWPPAGTPQESPSFENELRPPVLIRGAGGYGLLQPMEHYGVPGVSVAVIKDFKISLARGYGVKQEGGDDPVTVETLFQGASLSKPVTAMAALNMVEAGELILDDRRFHFQGSNLVWYVSVWNVYNRKNVASYTWNGVKGEVDTIYQWGMLPIFGLEWEF